MQKNIGLFILLALLIISINSCNSFQKPSEIAVDPEQLANAEAVKLKITQEGIYRVNLSDLGWDTSTFDNISLTHKGLAVPYEIQTIEHEANLIFFGQVSSSPYTPNNFYVLEQNNNNKLLIETESVSAPGPTASDSIIQTIHMEENHLYVPKVTGGSPWHWTKIVAPQSHVVEVDLPNATKGPGQLRAALWGTTSAPTSPDHHVRVRINGQDIGEAAWDDQSWQILDVQIPDGVLVKGSNTVEIQATGEAEARIDIFNLDWLEIDYPKLLDKVEGQEIFRLQGESIQLTGIKQPLLIFEISNPTEIVRLVFLSKNGDSMAFQGHPDHKYLAVTEDGYYSPDQILPLTVEPDLRAASGTSYIAIGYPELLAPLEPLLQTRTEQGLSTQSIPIETIYDQFNGGIPEPEAVQAFLAFAVENWETPPRYILLVGDTSYDFYGYQTPLETNLIPTFLVPTTFGGETGSDLGFVQLGNENLSPSLAIGRVPARSAEQVETFVAKTLGYEQISPDSDRNDFILAIADGQEPTFKSDANHFVEQFSEDYQTEIIAPEAGVQGINQQISGEIENGTLITAYFGHGSVNMWGKDSLFTTQDSADLENSEHLSIVWNFTCLTGLFTHPTEESLAESLLFNPQGGAVAVLAPTSPTLPGDQSFLSDALVEALIQNPAYRLGDITLYAWQQVPTRSPGTIDVMQTFLLFGDPALQLPSP